MAKQIRFAFRTNPNYDIALLTETESINPFAQKKANAAWNVIATNLRECTLKIKVTGRSCKDRVDLLMDQFRKDETVGSRASGIEEDQLTEIKTLLTKVKELMDSVTPKVKPLYKKQTRDKAEAIREEALAEIEATIDEDEPFALVQADVGDDAADESPGTKEEENNTEKIEPEKQKRMGKGDMIGFLAKKQKTEAEIKKEELQVRMFEAENRRLELYIQKERQVAESQDRSKITDLLVKLLDKN